jgi:hypothetical protein
LWAASPRARVWRCWRSRALARFRNLTLNTYRLAGRANIAHTRRDLHDRADAFAVCGMLQTITEPDREKQRRACRLGFR